MTLFFVFSNVSSIKSRTSLSPQNLEQTCRWLVLIYICWMNNASCCPYSHCPFPRDGVLIRLVCYHPRRWRCQLRSLDFIQWISHRKPLKPTSRGMACSNLHFSKINLLPNVRKKLRESWRPIRRLFKGALVRDKEVSGWKVESGKEVRTIVGVEWRDSMSFSELTRQGGAEAGRSGNGQAVNG